MSNEWEVQVKGERCSEVWEISVIKKSDEHGHKSWGWFGSTKILISHNGGPCRWKIPGYVFDENIKIAHKVAEKLNLGEKVDYACL